MATRRPSDPTRSPGISPDVGKEIPKVIKADEPAPTRTGTGTPSTARPKKTTIPGRVTISEDVRRSMIAEAAYLRAERRGFAPGHEDEDWVAAEAEVDALLKARHTQTAQ